MPITQLYVYSLFQFITYNVKILEISRIINSKYPPFDLKLSIDNEVKVTLLGSSFSSNDAFELVFGTLNAEI